MRILRRAEGISSMAFAVVRVRSTVQAGRRVEETLAQLHLCKINHMVVVPENSTTKGMLNKIKDHVTWGEVSPEMIARVLLKRGEMIGGSPGLSDALIKNSSAKYTSIISFAKAMSSNEARLSDVKNLQPVIRLHPPKGGYENIKLSFRVGGTLGYRGKKIEKLLQRMMADSGKR